VGPLTLRAGETALIEALSTVVALQFRETLGLGHVEVLVSPSDAPARRIPALSPGATGTFAAGGWCYELQVLTLEEAARTVEILIRPLSPL
jgi:hypothetical protein